ncbi:hypothetical protein D3C72_2177260 [compost metagenome]
MTVLAQALVAQLAGFHPQARQVDVGDPQLLALAYLQGAALQGRGMGEGRGRQHH